MKKFDYTFVALWTFCQITIVTQQQKPKNHDINFLYKYIQDFEDEFSRFRFDSELMKLNTLKIHKVTDRFLRLLYRSREMYILTEGFFNPLVDVRTIGYTSSFELQKFSLHNTEPNTDFLSIKNYGNQVELQSGMFLDFWSIAKWFLADEIAEKLENLWYKNFFVNMWWDIKVWGKNVFWKDWNIWIQSPFIAWETVENISLTNKSISTSWTYLRNWKIQEKTYHHIIDPFHNNQEKHFISASIIDFHWYKTDAIATAVLAMWEQKAIEFCEKHHVQYIFINSEWKIFKN